MGSSKLNHPNPADNLRWDLLIRLRLIEILAYWEGRVSTTHLSTSFGIARQQASKNLNHYIKHIAPKNLVYDASIRGYKPTEHFTPVLTQGITEEYLQALASYKKDEQALYPNLELVNTELLSAPLRQVQPAVVRTLTQAIHNQQKIDIGYVSLFSPDESSRIIAPHTLVCTPLRWHVRAYCEKNRDFKDFVLSRFRSVYAVEGKASTFKEEDKHWNTYIELEIKPDPRLSSYQQAIIAHDYNMQQGKFSLKTRIALIPYLLQTLNIELDYLERSPEAQQIVISNAEEIKRYLFPTRSM